MANGIRTGDPHGFNKGRSSKFREGSRVRRTPEEGRCPRGVMVKAMNCGIVVREFVLQSCYYVHFRANTLRKGMNPPYSPSSYG